MKSTFSKNWKKSKQPRKQVKYKLNAPLHIKGKMLSCHLSSELKNKYQTRNIRLRTGDKVKVLRGNHKGEEQKVEKIDIKKEKVYLEKIELAKKDGSKIKKPFHPSNLMITNLNTDDKKRMNKFQVKQKTEQTPKNKSKTEVQKDKGEQ